MIEKIPNLNAWKVFCDSCKKQMVALNEEEACEDIIGHGWTNYHTAQNHICFTCSEKDMKRAGYPPCGICYNKKRCEYGDCWATPPQTYPYETYYADTLEESMYIEKPKVINLTPTEEEIFKAIAKRKCPHCNAKLWQHPNNKYLLSCPDGCEGEYRNPKYKKQKTIGDFVSAELAGDSGKAESP